ncbi:collagen alpha-1(II) chain-like [Canis lupus familiaris]|uniref:collagen alpha-1(II) chain-like n=1 Tax=Canis lupus familiaris TaxID=9615 RepID=UPI0003AE2C99|nr:collagen alpha-1(II) chain-like [Canis lupus familiaris]|eukprot:XP_005637941.1 collagen alpha-1(II) chain-like [Canis lupus familiaris]
MSDRKEGCEGARGRSRAPGGAVRVDPPPRRQPLAARGRSRRAAANAGPRAGSPPTRRPLRALGGNKVHLCQRPGACHSPARGRGTRTGSCGNAALRPPPPPPPGPADFAFPALGKAGNGPEGSRPRDGGLRLGGAAAPRSPAPPASPGRARLQSGCGSRGRFPTPASERRSGCSAARPRDYKSQQAPRHERRGRRRGPPGACAVRPPEPASTTPPGGTEGRQKHPRH